MQNGVKQEDNFITSGYVTRRVQENKGEWNLMRYFILWYVLI